MGFKKQSKKATSRTPQVVTLIVDDSGSMQERVSGGKSKADIVTEGVQDLVLTMQTQNLEAGRTRYVVNICKFGDRPNEVAKAAKPQDLDLTKLVFSGTSGGTEMADALEWGAEALEASLTLVRSFPGYDEDASPNPLCLFLSDGANTGREVQAAAGKLKAVRFSGGPADVLAMGVGVDATVMSTMEHIASSPDYALKVDAGELADVLAAVSVTVQKGETTKELVQAIKAET